MPDYNVHMHAFGDLDMLREAVASIPEGVPIHVFDGRYRSFPGETDRTPGLEAYCGRHPDCRYYAPPAERLPFGEPTVPDEYRAGVYQKTRFAFEHLPGQEWTLKLDTDERLVRFDAELASLDARVRYCPVIDRVGQRDCYIARLFQPAYWTPWIDDCLLPREIFPRETPLACLARAHLRPEYRSIRFARRAETDAIKLRNVGAERDPDYQARRVEHLDAIGREERAAEIDARLDGE